MDLSCSLRQETSPNPGREFIGDDDDDEHFAELRRRILLLVAEDDADDENFMASKCPISVDPHKGSFNLFCTPAVRYGVNLGSASAQHEGSVTFLTTRANPKTGTGSGTGVFIPLANPRRRVCSGRTNGKRKLSRRLENK